MAPSKNMLAGVPAEEDLGIGIVGKLPEDCLLDEIVELLEEEDNVTSNRHTQDPNQPEMISLGPGDFLSGDMGLRQLNLALTVRLLPGDKKTDAKEAT
jgi:hypothetical protein